MVWLSNGLVEECAGELTVRMKGLKAAAPVGCGAMFCVWNGKGAGEVN